VKRFIVFISLLALLAGLLTGCRPQFQPGSYTDDLGRTVAIDKVPQRIVSFGPSITEILFALGLDEKVVGVTEYCDYPAAARTKARVGNAFAPSLESVVKLEPDLVVTVKHEQLNQELDNLGVKSLVLDPKTIDDIYRDIEMVGQITGAAAKANDLVSGMKEQVSRITAEVAAAPKVSTFFVIDATDPNSPWTGGAGSFIDALVSLAGGDNVAAVVPGVWVQFSMEELVKANPDVIIVQTMAGGEPTIATEALQAHPAWREIAAVKQGRVCFVNGDLVSRPGPRIVDGLAEIAKAIHPEIFK
jgi:iron complex transport system substrate-binding protein